MKKLLLGAIFMLGLSMGVKAQFNLGIKGGVNFSEVNADNFRSSTMTGYQAGLFARIGGPVYLQPEVYLSSVGGNFHSNDFDYSGNVRFTKLNVPLLLGFRFGSDALNFRIMGGPIYSYTINTDENFSANFNEAYNDFGHYNNSTLGIQGGAGVDIGPLTVDGRYEGGLSDVNKSFGQRQNLWALSVGFKFL
jgi:hypothetical protein